VGAPHKTPQPQKPHNPTNTPQTMIHPATTAPWDRRHSRQQGQQLAWRTPAADLLSNWGLLFCGAAAGTLQARCARAARHAVHFLAHGSIAGRRMCLPAAVTPPDSPPPPLPPASCAGSPSSAWSTSAAGARALPPLGSPGLSGSSRWQCATCSRSWGAFWWTPAAVSAAWLLAAKRLAAWRSAPCRPPVSQHPGAASARPPAHCPPPSTHPSRRHGPVHAPVRQERPLQRRGGPGLQ
jgi:hypothetical protein